VEGDCSGLAWLAADDGLTAEGLDSLPDGVEAQAGGLGRGRSGHGFWIEPVAVVADLDGEGGSTQG